MNIIIPLGMLIIYERNDMWNTGGKLMDDLLRVGVISSTHGIRGEVKVYPTTDDVNRFKKLKKVLLDTGKELIDMEIEGVRFFKQMVIVKFKGFDNINDIEKYKGKDLLVTRENAVKLEEGEYFIYDLIDCSVVTDKGEDFGTLVEVLQTGANDVYVVKTTDGKEVLLPNIDQCILDVNIEEKKITAHIMEGLID